MHKSHEIQRVVTLVTGLSFALWLHGTALADSIRVSFLNDQAALQDTLKFLKESGCGADSIAGFRQAVEHYNSTELAFSVTGFPRVRDGFYHFRSVSQLLSALPSRLCDVSHPFELNCFDTVILVGGGELRSDWSPDKPVGNLLPAGELPDGHIAYAHAQTTREAFSLSYTPSYREVSDKYFSTSIADAHQSDRRALLLPHASGVHKHAERCAASNR